jgi:hypothetical protein
MPIAEPTLNFMRTLPRPLHLSCIVLALALLGTGCDFLSGSEESEVDDALRQRVEQERAKWQEQSITTYRLELGQRIGTTLVDTVKVFVRDGAVDSIYTSREIPQDEVAVTTVESFFDRIKDRIGEDTSEFTADFDEERGYPTEYRAGLEDEPNEVVVTHGLYTDL